MGGVIPKNKNKNKKIPFKEPFEKMQPFKEKKLMTVRFQLGLTQFQCLQGPCGCCTFVRLEIIGSFVE